jgi:predicted dinucleotide-binding enzyme
MKRKVKIGIIGAGNIGWALTRHFTRLEHDVVVANSRGPESLAGLVKETGAQRLDVRQISVTSATFPRSYPVTEHCGTLRRTQAGPHRCRV